MVAPPPMMSAVPHAPWGGAPGAGGDSLPGLAPVSMGVGAPQRGGAAAAYRPPLPADPGRAGAGPSTQHLTMSVEAMAFAGLRELASSLVPGAPLRTTGDVARLLTKLHDTLEVFCRCFVPLRDMYTQSLSADDLQSAMSQRAFNRSPSAMQLEGARDPAGVAAALLHWGNDHYDAPQVVEGILADLMSHQMAMIDGIARGVSELLSEIAPEKIEEIVRTERPVTAVMGRYRTLWNTYRERHEQLRAGMYALELVLGHRLTESYREYSSRRGTQRPGTGSPGGGTGR
jgi:hypothetical protein